MASWHIPKNALAAAKCTGATGSIGLASWGVYALEHVTKFNGQVQGFEAWLCLGAIALGLLLAGILTIRGAVVTLFAKPQP